MKTGIVVALLTVFIIIQSVWVRRHNNRLAMEKKLLQEQFDTQIMHNKIEVQEATFDSLGTELHDNIGQLLSTAKMFIGITERNQQHPSDTLAAANNTLDKAIRELRDLSKSLNRDWLKQFDLYRNLAADMERINSASGLQIILSRSSHTLPAGAEQQFIFYRLLQEGIQNVIKHAAARFINISISYDNQFIKARLQDDGKGFDTERQHAGLGIKIMQQRVKLLKGKIDWQSSVTGTRISISFPVKKSPI